MAILQIPVRSDLPAYEFIIELDQANYMFRFQWNSRSELWTMDIATTEGVEVVAGIPMLVNTDLIGRFQSDDLPPGALIVFDTSKSGANPGRYNFGTDFLLLYEEVEE